jgi:hypothetical protein
MTVPSVGGSRGTAQSMGVAFRGTSVGGAPAEDDAAAVRSTLPPPHARQGIGTRR